MRAARTVAPGIIEIVDVEPPDPKPDEVLVHIEQVGICGSDVGLYGGTHPSATFPTIQGHEFVGTVLEPGPRADLTAGQRVVVEPLLACGTCHACRAGRGNACAHLRVIGAEAPGALQEQLSVPAPLVHLADDLSPDIAVLTEPMSISLQGVHRGRIAAGERVLILGAGPIGQGCTVAANDLGADVMVTDLVAPRLELASALGASRTVHAPTEGLAEAVADWTGGEGVSAVIDATGVPAVVRTAFDLVAHAGRIVLIGISTADLVVPLSLYTRKELDILGSRNNAGLFPSAVDLVRRHADAVGALVTHRLPLREVQVALDLVRDHPEETQKVVVEMNQ